MESRIKIYGKEGPDRKTLSEIYKGFSPKPGSADFYSYLQFSEGATDEELRGFLKETRVKTGIKFRFWRAQKIDDQGGVGMHVSFLTHEACDQFDEYLEKSQLIYKKLIPIL